MMQHVASARSTGAERHGGRMMIVAVPPDLVPPVSFGSTLYQRLRIIVLSPRDLDEIGPSHILGELPPLKSAAARAATSAARPRRLQGELLCDESGRFYEKIGNFVRPVHQLVAGPRGEVLDLTPPESRRPAPRDGEVIDVPEEAPARDEPDQPAAPWRELPASAKPRIVRFGEFKTTLAPQLLHPERLRDAHRLPCRVRVVEAGRSQRSEALAAALGAANAQLLALTPSLASRLDLMDLVASRRPSANEVREAGQILAGERAVLLSVLHDPTAAVSRGETQPEPSRVDAAVAPAIAASPPPHGRTAIPERFLVPWQFACTREEAVYDLDACSAAARLGALVRSWYGRLTSGRELRKWQALLAGKSFDDQLWAVRPPRAALSGAGIREWVRRTLEAGGYDTATMLREWEIYWARKRA